MRGCSNSTMIKGNELVNSLQICLDREAKIIMLPITLVCDLGTVSTDLVGSLNFILYSSPEDAAIKVLGVK